MAPRRPVFGVPSAENPGMPAGNRPRPPPRPPTPTSRLGLAFGRGRCRTSEEDPMGRYKQLLTVVLFLAALLAIAEVSGVREHFSLGAVRQTLLDHRWEGLALFIALFTAGNLIQVPGWIFLAAAVLALGRVWGGLVTYGAALVSCAVTYWVIRALGGDALARLDGKLASRLVGQLHVRPIRSITLLRLLFQTLPALNYVLALSGVGFRNYMLGTLLGLPLPIAAYCLLFDELASLLGHAV